MGRFTIRFEGIICHAVTGRDPAVNRDSLVIETKGSAYPHHGTLRYNVDDLVDPVGNGSLPLSGAIAIQFEGARGTPSEDRSFAEYTPGLKELAPEMELRPNITSDASVVAAYVPMIGSRVSAEPHAQKAKFRKSDPDFRHVSKEVILEGEAEDPLTLIVGEQKLVFKGQEAEIEVLNRSDGPDECTHFELHYLIGVPGTAKEFPVPCILEEEKQTRGDTPGCSNSTWP